MSFLHIVSRFDTYQLSHQTIHQIRVILSFISFRRGKKFQFHQFRISHIVQSEQVGTGFLNRRAVSLQRIRIYSRKQLPGTMSQTLMQIRVKFVRQIGISVDQLSFRIAINEFLIKPVSMSRLIVSVRNVTDSHRFRTVMRTNPVSIRKIDTDSSWRIEITGKDSSGNHLSRHTLHFIFLERLVHRRMILEPLSIAANYFRTASSF